MYFAASFDRTTKIVSALVITIPLAVCLVVKSPLPLVLAGVVGVLGFAWSPRGYMVSADAITVKRLDRKCGDAAGWGARSAGVYGGGFERCDAAVRQRGAFRVLRVVSNVAAGELHLVCDEPAKDGGGFGGEDMAFQPG